VSGVGRSNDLCRLAHVQDADLVSGPDCGERCRAACFRNRECRFAGNDPGRGGDQKEARITWPGFALGCIVCAGVRGRATVIEAAHTNAMGPRGLGQKTTDFSAIPLCSGHHWTIRIRIIF
jgi:hypothetical protein